MIQENYLDKLKELCKCFQEQNEKLNLSSFKDFDSTWPRNVLDSLLVEKYLQEGFEKLIDIGTGGGFPLLPLAVCHPDKQFFGVDSINKKLVAVESICEQMDIGNVEVLHARAEQLAFDTDFRERFDVVISRAFAKLPINLELCVGFLKLGGIFVAMLGPSSKLEIEACQDLIGELGCEIEKFECDSTKYGERCFLVLKKIKPLDSKYPRTPKKLKRIFKI